MINEHKIGNYSKTYIEGFKMYRLKDEKHPKGIEKIYP